METSNCIYAIGLYKVCNNYSYLLIKTNQNQWLVLFFFNYFLHLFKSWSLKYFLSLEPIQLIQDGLEEEKNCLRVVLLHEVELLNKLLEMSKETFETCRLAMLGIQVVTSEVESVVEAVKTNSILDKFKVYI